MKLPPASRVGIEHGEGVLLIERPAEDVAAEAEREDVQIGVGQSRDRLSLAASEVAEQELRLIADDPLKALPYVEVEVPPGIAAEL